MDGLITNGVLIMHPRKTFGDTSYGVSVWREVSVGGGIYALRESRSIPQKSSLVRCHPQFDFRVIIVVLTLQFLFLFDKIDYL